MITVQDAIIAEFYLELAKSSIFDDERIEKLKALFNSGKKLKPVDIIEVLSQNEKDVQ